MLASSPAVPRVARSRVSKRSISASDACAAAAAAASADKDEDDDGDCGVAAGDCRGCRCC